MTGESDKDGGGEEGLTTGEADKSWGGANKMLPEGGAGGDEVGIAEGDGLGKTGGFTADVAGS